MNIVLVACGGAAGATVRYLAMLGVGRVLGTGFPYGTLAVNIVGSLAMGLLIGWLARVDAPMGMVNTQWHMLLAVGVLGGFTTFSAFSLDTVTLLQRGAMGEAALYITASVLACVGATFAGLLLMRILCNA